jgi:hypothetical protein
MENVRSRNLRRAPPEWTIRALSLYKRCRSQFALPQSVFLLSLLITLLATMMVFLISNFRRVLNVVTENSDVEESPKRWRNCSSRDVEPSLNGTRITFLTQATRFLFIGKQIPFYLQLIATCFNFYTKAAIRLKAETYSDLLQRNRCVLINKQELCRLSQNRLGLILESTKGCHILKRRDLDWATSKSSNYLKE